MHRNKLFQLLLLLASTSSNAGTLILVPDSMITEGIPPISAGLIAEVSPYTEIGPVSFTGWHPTRREMLINTRSGQTPQVVLVHEPNGTRTLLTNHPERAYGGNFNPQLGGYFIFDSDQGGNEAYQLYRFDLASKETTLLTDGKSRHPGRGWSASGGLAAIQSWSRSGERYAYVRLRSTPTSVVSEIHVMDPLEPKTDRQVAEFAGGGAIVVDWSLDDQLLLVLDYLSISDGNLWLLDIASGTKELLTPKSTGKKASYAGGQFTKKGVLTATDRDSEFLQLAFIDPASKTHTALLPEREWSVETYSLSPDGEMVAFTTNEDGFSVLRFLDLDSRVIRTASTLDPGVVSDLEWHRNSEDIGFTFSNAITPSNAFSLNAWTLKLTQWTKSPLETPKVKTFSKPQTIKWEAADSRLISGLLYRPPSKFTGPRPVMIVIHGGPEAQSRPGYLERRNYYLNELGVALIFPNIRGSSGYGKTFLDLDNGIKREDAYNDIGALLRWIATQPHLNKNRVMVTGGSYGGHATLVTATRHADQIRCAQSFVGMSHLKTFLQNTESFRRDLRRQEYGDERDEKMRAWMDETAPLNNASKITKPLFVVQGFNDPRVPRSESLQIVETVKKQGVPTWFLMAKDEGHGFAKKNNQDFHFYATVAFVKEHLLKSE